MAHPLTIRQVWCGIGVLALLLLGGCSGKPPVYPVRGEVRDSEGKPAKGVLVVFHPVGEANSSEVVKPVGRVDENGEFHLTTYVEGDGAPAGDYAVTLVWPAPRKTPFDPEGGDQLGGAYAHPDTPKTHFTVEKRDNQVPIIQLP